MSAARHIHHPIMPFSIAAFAATLFALGLALGTTIAVGMLFFIQVGHDFSRFLILFHSKLNEVCLIHILLFPIFPEVNYDQKSFVLDEGDSSKQNLNWIMGWGESKLVFSLRIF